MAFVCVPKPKVIEDEMVTADDDTLSTVSSIEILEGVSSSSSTSSSSASSAASSGATTPVRTVTPTAPPLYTPSTRGESIFADAFRGEMYDESPAPPSNVVSIRDNAGGSSSSSSNSPFRPMRPPPNDHFTIITPDGMFVVPRAPPVRKGLWHCTKQVSLLSWRLVAAASERCLARVEQTIDMIADRPPSNDALARELSPEEIFFGANVLLLVTMTVGYYMFKNLVALGK